MRIVGSAPMALLRSCGISAASRLPWCARSHAKSWLEIPELASATIVSAPKGGVTPSEQTPIAAFRVRAMRRLARGARVEHLYGRVGPDVEHHEARLSDVVDLNLRLVACSQQSPL